MALSHTEERTFTALETVELCTRRDSDASDQEPSEAESEASAVDSVPEEMFLDGMDDALDWQNDSDPDWEPDTEVDVEMDSSELISIPAAEPEPGPSSSKIPRTEMAERGREDCGERPSSPSEGSWNGPETADITPTPLPFCPTRTPGPQILSAADDTCLELFKLFFTDTMLLTLVKNTNVHGCTTYKIWTDITLEDIFSFLSLVIYTGLTKVPSLTDYWRRGKLYSLPFPKTVMTGKKFIAIVRALHLSSPEDDAENEGKRGTEEFDRLGKIKPLYMEMRDACRQNYQPGQNISIDERMVASKTRVLFKQNLKSKPVRMGFKLFVLTDSQSGYTWDFFVYEGKCSQPSKNGLSYDSVMNLLNTSLLGTGYKLYVDNFYTSPILFRDLLQKNVSACGTIRPNRQGYPKTTQNTLDSTAPLGSIRWIREDPVLFVQWRDTRDVFVCSTMHTAHGQETVERRVKDDTGCWTVKDVPIPPAIKDYIKHTGDVDLSDALIGYYEVLHRTKKWYKTFFYHFVDIAIVNAFILYKEHCGSKGKTPMPQKAFRETLVLELAEAGVIRTQQEEGSREGHHRLVHINPGGGMTQGRLKCRKCHAKTSVKCSTCNIPLCFQPQRDCYSDWHTEDQP
ncbi:hypothetical protein NQD34_001131 [Periophthalmus magnuspinnatus]|nr:hypothetical protein NQD34_001131 [Periophthalmus magnuspinnatus]